MITHKIVEGEVVHRLRTRIKTKILAVAEGSIE
jgi:hypothetical protein